MALKDNLISHWKLDEASGNALDAHGSNELTENGTIGTAAGKVNGARDFEAGDAADVFRRADNADLSTGDIDFTFACWIRGETLASQPHIASKGGSVDNANKEWGLKYNTATSRLEFTVRQSTTTTTVSANTHGALSTATWYFVVVWHDAVNNQIGISVNAGTADTASHTAGVNNGNRDFAIGADVYDGTPRWWDGLIDEASFWKRVITSDERTELYNAGNGLDFDDWDAGGNTYDETGSGGIVMGGAGNISVTYAPAPAGGIILGGTGSTTATYNPAPAGGIILGGTVSVAAIYNQAASGGIAIAGAGAANSSYNPSPTGGMVIGGEATVTQVFTVAASGGVVIGGTAVVSGAAAVEFVSGGITLPIRERSTVFAIPPRATSWFVVERGMTWPIQERE